MYRVLEMIRSMVVDADELEIQLHKLLHQGADVKFVIPDKLIQIGCVGTPYEVTKHKILYQEHQ